MRKEQNKIVVISGASRGIGKATALLLSNNGFIVYAGVRSDDSYNEYISYDRPNLIPFILDITNESHIIKLKEELSGRPVCSLVNNAGIGLLGPLEFLPLQEIKKQFDVNFFGHISLIKALMPNLRERKGRIINISSISGLQGFSQFGVYSASKFAIEGLSQSLRLELSQFGIKVIVINPGNTDTDIWKKSYSLGKSILSESIKKGADLYPNMFSCAKEDFGPGNRTSADAVAAVIYKAISKNIPRERYLVGDDAKGLYMSISKKMIKEYIKLKLRL